MGRFPEQLLHFTGTVNTVKTILSLLLAHDGNWHIGVVFSDLGIGEVAQLVRAQDS